MERYGTGFDRALKRSFACALLEPARKVGKGNIDEDARFVGKLQIRPADNET